MLWCVCQTQKPVVTSASYGNWHWYVWDIPSGILNGHYCGLPGLWCSFLTACDHSIASVPQKEVWSLWLSLVQSPLHKHQSQNARGIRSSNETHPDAPSSSGQAQIKHTTSPFYRCPLTRPKHHPLVRKALTLVLAVFTVLCNFCTHG